MEVEPSLLTTDSFFLGTRHSSARGNERTKDRTRSIESDGPDAANADEDARRTRGPGEDATGAAIVRVARARGRRRGVGDGERARKRTTVRGTESNRRPEEGGRAIEPREERRMASASSAFTETIRVRFSETDGQGVVFNGSYPVYADAALDAWMERAMGVEWTKNVGRALCVAASSTWEFKRSAKFMDRLAVKCSVVRWGTTSFDVAYDGTLEPNGEACFAGRVTYVCVSDETRRPVPVPGDMKAALSGTTTTTTARSRL